MPHDLQHLKQRVPLLDYLLRHNWTARPIGSHKEFVGYAELGIADAMPSSGLCRVEFFRLRPPRVS
jgi:hypothetical protein